MSRRSDEVKRWRRWILDIEGDAYEKSALHVLVQYADENGECWPSLGRIAREAGMSERKARAIVRSLEDVGHIQVLRSRHVRYLNPARQVSQPGTACPLLVKNA